MAHPAHADDEHTVTRLYFDFFSPEAVGYRGDKTYDLSTSDAFPQFLGKQTVTGGDFFGAGFGFRNLIGFHHGALILDELLATWGQLDGAAMPWQFSSTATHVEVMLGAGWGFSAGPFFFHTATVAGGAYMGFDVTGALSSSAALIQMMGGTPSPSGTFHLSTWDLRIGQQVGVHVQMGRMAAIFVDGTIDYDAQWRVRAGISVGNHDFDQLRRR